MARNGKVSVKFTADTSDLRKGTRVASKEISGVGKAASGLAKLGGAALALGGLSQAFSDVMAEAQESRKVTAQTAAVLKSTGHQAGVSAKEIEKLATALSRKTAIDDEAIQSAENLLLTFGKVGKEAFPDATRAIVDMSVAMGTDMKSSTIQVGKALNDPIKGITALTRVGVTFTQGQKDQIKTLVESGRTLDAQKIILKELNTEFGGSAAAAATPIDRMRTSVDNLKETVGLELAPYVDKAATAVAGFVEGMQDGTGDGGKFVDQMKRLWKETQPVAAAALDVAKAVGRFTAKHPEIIKVVAGMVAVGGAVRAIKFASKISGLSSFLSAAKVGATTFRGLWARAGTRAADDAVDNLASRTGRTLPDKIRGQRGSIRGAGRILGGIFAAGAAAVILVEVGKAIDDALGVTPKGRERSNKADPNNFFGFLDKLKNPLNNIGGGDGWGRRPFTGDGPGRIAGASSANLDGAKGGLRHYANVAAGFGLRVSDGKRAAGTRTRSGGVSYHGSGDALDFSDGTPGPSGAKLRFAKAMVSRYGEQLEELIYTPLGFSIKDGRKVAAYAKADHMDHVHVADTSPSQGAGSRFNGGRTPTGKKGTFVRGKGSWFGGPRDKMDKGRTALWMTTGTPGCAIRPGDHYNSGQPFLGGYWRITAPNGETAVLQQTDIGPNQSTGRRIDITYSALDRFGYTEQTFPTDGTFRAYYLGARASTSAAKKVMTPKQKKLLAAKKLRHSIGVGKRQAGVRRSVNASRQTRIDAGYENRYTLASLTASQADDYLMAVQGYAAADMRVRQYQYGLSHGDRRVTGDMLTQAISDRQTWADRRGTAAEALAGPDRSGQFAPTAADSTSATTTEGRDELLASMRDELRQMNSRAEAILRVSGGDKIQAVIGAAASGWIGSSFALANQSAGRGSGQHATY